MMKKAQEQAKKKSIHLVAAFGAVGVIAFGAIAIGMMNSGDDKTPGRIDLNGEPTPGQARPTETAKRDGNHKGITPTQAPSENQVTVTPPVTDGEKTETKPEVKPEDNRTVAENIPGSEEEETPVLSPDGVMSRLNFSAETGMLWPVSGEVLVNFSSEHAIYHKTLDCYRTSDYVLLGAETGTHVGAAVDGVVTEIFEDVRTGTTVKMQISPEHEIVYGMVGNVVVKEGDYVDAGTVFATVAEPTRYYCEEGSGVYLQVLEKEQPVNPMLFLQ